jgi:hypothetical protein
MPVEVVAARSIVHLSPDRCFVLAPDAQEPQLSQVRWHMPANW